MGGGGGGGGGRRGRKGYSRVDHMFTLYAVVLPQAQENCKLYVASVD